MSGVIEQLMSKMDTMISNLSEYNDTNRQLLELLKTGKGGAAAATGDGAVVENKPATTRRKAATTETAPKTTEAALKTKFDELKSTDTEARMPKLKKVISDAGFANLKELLGAPAKFDEAMAALEALEAEFAAAPADQDDDL